MAYEPRTYRRSVRAEGLVSFEVVRGETDLQIWAKTDLGDRAAALVEEARTDIERYLRANPRFAESFVPIEIGGDAPEIVRSMAVAGLRAGVGPMAAVAGAVAEYVARGLAADSAEVIVENGGDVYAMGGTDRVVALVAGDSPLSGKVGILLEGDRLPMAVATSSGTVGHSTSFGEADAVTVLAEDAAVADAVASELGNRVHEPDDVERVLEEARYIEGITGVVVVVGDRLGVWGHVRLVPLV